MVQAQRRSDVKFGASPLSSSTSEWSFEMKAGVDSPSRAAISSKHTLAITNRGGASAEQVAELSRYVRAQVANRFGVELQPEPIAVGVAL